MGLMIDTSREACYKLKEQGRTREEIAKILGISERQVKRRLSTNGFKGAYNKVNEKTASTISSSIFQNAEPAPTIIERNGDDYFSTVVDEGFVFPKKDNSLFRFEFGDQKREGLRQYIESKYKGKPVKILYLSDLHIPFTMYEDVEKIVKEHKDADVVVINGDLLDLFAVSKFAKDKEIALRREIEEGRKFLEFLSKRFKDVIITEGNHERRLRSFIKNMIPTDMQFLFPDDILQMVVDGHIIKKTQLKNVHVVGSWWFKMFDVIIAHPDNYSNASLKTVQNTSEFFSLIKNIWHRVCIIGHTHRAGWIMSGEVLQMETGCLCYDMDYHNGSNFTKTKWTRAYAVIHIGKDGLSDFNKTELQIVG
jgi:predicted phosphodiesterase